METSFILSKCKTKATFSAKLLSARKLDLGKIKKEFEVVVDTPILVVIKTACGEVIVHNYGELLFKTCTDHEQMEKIAGKVYGVGKK